MTLTADHHLQDVLADLVSHEILTPEQAHAVTDAMAENPPDDELAVVATSATVAAPPVASPLRARLVEAAAYLGGVLVGASLLVIVAQDWGDLGNTARISVLAILGLAAAAIGYVVAASAGPRAVLRERVHAARRRVASVLLSLGSVFLASSLAVAMGDNEYTPLVAVLVALALLVIAQLLAPSAITEVGMFAASAVATGLAVALVTPEPPIVYDGYGPPPTRGWDYVPPLALGTLGLIWAAAVSRLLTLPVVATVAGLLLTLIAAIVPASDEGMRTVGLWLLAALAVLGLAVFVWQRAWPWLAFTVLSISAFVFILVAASGAQAMAFLVTGLVLLAGAGVATWFGRRHVARPGSPSAG